MIFSSPFRLKTIQKHLSCKHLAALSLYEAKMYSEALGLLEVDFEWKDLPAKSCVDSASPFPSSENVKPLMHSLLVGLIKCHICCS